MTKIRCHLDTNGQTDGRADTHGEKALSSAFVAKISVE